MFELVPSPHLSHESVSKTGLSSSICTWFKPMLLHQAHHLEPSRTQSLNPMSVWWTGRQRDCHFGRWH